MTKHLLRLLVAALISSIAAAQDHPSVVAATSDSNFPTAKIEKGILKGYIVAASDRIGEENNAGFSLYSAAYPLLEKYPGHQFQSGLFGTWMFAHVPKPPFDLYSDVEGGLGWWRETHFPTTTPKFIMGGVGPNFSFIANGPGSGSGDNDGGLFGVAQLSPWLLFPLDGLNLKQGTCGQLLGYGYLPLPLTAEKKTTKGEPVTTGNQSWTLFLNAANFKGPVAFFTPFFWAQAKLKDPRVEGLLLDQAPTNANRDIQMETQYIPCVISHDRNQEAYARIAVVFLPVEEDGKSVLLRDNRSYDKSALWNGVEAWFNGGQPVSGEIASTSGALVPFGSDGFCTWEIRDESDPGDKAVALDCSSFLKPKCFDPNTYGCQLDDSFATKVQTPDGPLVKLPEYYHLTKTKDGNRWQPLHAADVPEETGLTSYTFPEPREPRQEPLEIHLTGPLKSPGPAAGPFQTTLGDGSVVTYYWYRFADQPAILSANLTNDERETLQKRVTLLHQTWKKETNYLPPPQQGTLAQIDPALLVTPPQGMEAGYVPIATSQKLP